MGNISAAGGPQGIGPKPGGLGGAAGATGKDNQGNAVTSNPTSTSPMAQAAAASSIPIHQPQTPGANRNVKGAKSGSKGVSKGDDDSGGADKADEKKESEKSKKATKKGITRIEDPKEARREQHGRFAQQLKNMAKLKQLRSLMDIIHAAQDFDDGKSLKPFADVTDAHEALMAAREILEAEGDKDSLELSQSCYAAATDFRASDEGANIQAGYNLRDMFEKGDINAYRMRVLQFEKPSQCFAEIMEDCGGNEKNFESRMNLLLSAIQTDLSCSNSSMPKDHLNTVMKELSKVHGFRTVHKDSEMLLKNMEKTHHVGPAAA